MDLNEYFELLISFSYLKKYPKPLERKEYYSQADMKRNDFNGTPNVISRNAMTLATPVNELKFYYHVSDLIGNNYSPQAKSLNIKSLNEFNKINDIQASKKTLNRKITQSVPDFLFTSSNHVSRVSPSKENGYSKSVKLPPIADALHMEENGAVENISNLLSENFESNMYENSKNNSTSLTPVIQPKQTKFFKRKNHLFLDDDNETVTSVKSLGSNVNFSNHSSSLVSGISSKTHMSVNYGPSKYKIKRSQSFIYNSDNDNDSIFDAKPNGIETIVEQNEQLNDKKKNANNLVRSSNNNLNSSKVEELFAILLSSNGDMKEKKKSRNRNISLKNRTSSIAYGSSVNSKLAFPQPSVIQNLDKNHKNESKTFYSRQNIKTDKLVMNVIFPPWFVSTHGLTRPSSPIEESEKNYYSILNESIEDTMLAGVSDETIENIESRVNSQLLKSVKFSIIDHFRKEIRSHYLWAMKKCILDYILKEEDEQKRLGIKLKCRVINLDLYNRLNVAKLYLN